MKNVNFSLSSNASMPVLLTTTIIACNFRAINCRDRKVFHHLLYPASKLLHYYFCSCSIKVFPS